MKLKQHPSLQWEGFFLGRSKQAAASQVLTNARELGNQSGILRAAVNEFLSTVRAA